MLNMVMLFKIFWVVFLILIYLNFMINFLLFFNNEVNVIMLINYKKNNLCK